MKRLCVFFLVAMTTATADTKFNALDKDDIHYEEYQKALCAGTQNNYRRFAVDRTRLDRERLESGDREDFAIDYVITTALRDSTEQKLADNCR